MPAVSARNRAACLAFLAAAWLVPSVASAQDTTAPRAGEGDNPAEALPGQQISSIGSSLPAKGDPLGLRGTLAERGIRYTINYSGELLANVAGGLRRGGLYEGLGELRVNVDLERLAGLQGLSFSGNAYQIHGTAGISRDFVGALDTISFLEALPTTRLSEIWLEQKLFDGTVALRAGQLAADTEFAVASYSLPFMNSGFPTISKFDLPGTGPAYPFAAPGVRVKWDPRPDVTVLAGAFNGNPAGRGGDPERLNRNGTNFRLNDPALLWLEGQYRYNQAEDAPGLAGAVRLGGWVHLGRFDSQRVDGLGRPLASPDSNGVAARLRGNTNVYAIWDQQLYRPEGGDANSGITAFARIGGAPGDRNLIDVYLDGGVVATGLVPGRPRDLFGVTALFSRLSPSGRRADLDSELAGLTRGRRSSEVAIEATYVAEIVPGWSIQPDAQYIIRPGGGVPAADGSLRRPGNARVIGLKTTLTY